MQTDRQGRMIDRRDVDDQIPFQSFGVSGNLQKAFSGCRNMCERKKRCARVRILLSGSSFCVFLLQALRTQ